EACSAALHAESALHGWREFDRARRDARMAGGEAAEDELPGREHARPRAAEDGGVELAAVEVLLRDRVGRGPLVHEGDAGADRALARHERGAREAERGSLRARLHDQREGEVAFAARARAALEHLEARHVDAAGGEHLLRERLVARERQAARVATG